MSWIITGEQKNNWTPAEITTALWLDAADASTITESGGVVSQWDDKSGNGKHATQSIAQSRPLLTGDGLNGRSVITFDGNDDFFSVSSFTGSRIISVFLVASQDTTTSNKYLLDESNTAQYGGGLSIRFTNTGTVRFWGQDVLPLTNSLALSASIPYIIGAIENTTQRNIYIDGTVNANITPGTDTRTAANPRIGHSLLLGGYHDGYIAEIILVASAVSTDTRQLIEGYLAHKWGLTANLPADHPYKTAIPVP